MKRKVGYTWKLREPMGTHGMFTTTELVPLLRDRGIELSASRTPADLVTTTAENASRAVAMVPSRCRRSVRVRKSELTQV
ncbi:hypothetical protein ACIQ6K_39350 [Streptomyces sp. NPDC096354]|uniref:hypothetical protein n=1 Tax=Streptomyces sp. NPDC096354 TaxID=3366088 RepID=UPI00381F4860